VAALGDRSRRALYGYVRTAGHPVTREDAAEATGISRGLAAFHLDKMVEAGLLKADYQPPAGQPRGRGRAPKVYLPTGEDISVTLPARRYELIAEILADAVAEDPTRADAAARQQAYAHGCSLAAELGGDGGDLLASLDELGFEPERHNGRVVLRNCPFHALASRHTELVCGLNLAFLRGLVDGHDAGVDACLSPDTGACCVQLHPHSP